MITIRVAPLALLLSLSAGAARADETAHAVSLPEAPVVIVVPDPAALDRVLSGGLRAALAGTLPSDDPVAAAFRRTRVGGKLTSQLALFSKDAKLDWPALVALHPTVLGLALLSPGNLEAVLAVKTPLAELPLKLPGGKAKTHKGAPYHVATRGAGDDATLSRRMGFSWARASGTLYLATSERALLLALDAAMAGRETPPPLPGLVSMSLDLAALRKDLYFRREYLFAEGLSGPETGVVRAAVRVVDGRLVEFREGEGEARSPAPTWDAARNSGSVAAAGWETDASRLFGALRRGLLEPVPSPSERPVVALRPLPDPIASGGDRYLVDLRKPAVVAGAPDQEGELPEWAAFLAASRLEGWGWEIGRGGERRLVVALPASSDARFAALAAATVSRRAGRAESAPAALAVGPGLPAVAWKRTGAFLWIGARSEDLRDVPEPRASETVVRWSRLDLAAVRGEREAWRRAEGAFDGDTTRPFSDRILGLLDWAPSASVLTVERRRDGNRWSETATLALSAAAPAKKSGARPSRRS